jgi:hypothetical protein
MVCRGNASQRELVLLHASAGDSIFLDVSLRVFGL